MTEYIDGYRDLLPTSPTNHLARSSFVLALIEVACALALLVVGFVFEGAVLLVVGSVVLGGLVMWTAAASSISIVNARRHGGTRLRQAIVALIISVVAAALIGWTVFEALSGL